MSPEKCCSGGNTKPPSWLFKERSTATSSNVAENRLGKIIFQHNDILILHAAEDSPLMEQKREREEAKLEREQVQQETKKEPNDSKKQFFGWDVSVTKAI